MSLLMLVPILASVGESVVDVLRWLLELPATIFRGYTWLLEAAADAVRNLFESYGYWVIFLGTLFENTLFVGLLIPGVLVVILAGLHAENGLLHWPLALALGILGTVIGDTISYFMGRFGWTRVGKGGSIHQFAEKVREPLLRRGPLFILVYHFAGYTRLMGPAAAGLLRMPYSRWAPFDYAGAALWISTYLAVGYALGLAGVSFDSSDRWFRVFEWGLLIFVLAVGLYLYYKGHRSIVRHLHLAQAASAKREEGGPKEGAASPTGD
jgi:membrane protein DedA with SNARE-associated domain